MKLTNHDVERALQFAIEKHKGQTRKGDGTPYIFHPISVLLILSKIKKSNNYPLIAIACILHDVVEDCDVTIEEIAKEFGHAVAALVDELTSNADEIALLGKAKYLGNKMRWMTSYALRIKLADRLHNLQDVDHVKHINKINETRHILDSIRSRKLTKTHQILIKAIKKKLPKEI